MAIACNFSCDFRSKTESDVLLVYMISTLPSVWSECNTHRWGDQEVDESRTREGGDR